MGERMAEMETFRTTIGRRERFAARRRSRAAGRVVDTGSQYTWIPRGVLESLGIKPQRRQGFLVADGRSVERDMGYAIVHAGGAATADDVVFGEDNDFVLLGVRSLEGLNLRLDVVRRQLVDAGPMLAVALTQF